MNLLRFRVQDWLAGHVSAVPFSPSRVIEHDPPRFANAMPWYYRFGLVVFGLLVIVIAAVVLAFLALFFWALITA